MSARLPRAAAFAFASVFALAVFAGSGPHACGNPTAVDPLRPGARADAALQVALDRIDATLGAALGIPATDRRAGVLDLDDGRFGLVRGDDEMYGASVPKIGILLGWFDAHPDFEARLAPGPDGAPSEVRRGLELMIKRSDNDQAARFSRDVGLTRLRALYTSERYRLYDPSRGGGLWSGKHYGADAPRVGDPLRDLSHAATARQVLRYYWMLEHGELVSEAASRAMRAVFAAPALDAHPTAFVAGLRGRNAGVIRKNGRWEDWHLDTAVIEHRGRRYALAGLAHHPRGLEYLEGLARELDRVMVGEVDAKLPIHRHHVLDRELGATIWRPFAPEDAAAFSRAAGPGIVPARATWESPVLRPGRLFDEAVVSWNIALPVGEGSGAAIELRVSRPEEGLRSPWLRVGRVGAAPAPAAASTDRVEPQAVTAFDGGRVDVDVFRGDERFDAIEVRVVASGPVEVLRLAVVTTDRSGLPVHAPDPEPRRTAAPDPAAVRRLPVPFRSQRWEPEEVRSRICSPTSVAMVLAHRGHPAPTLAVAEAVLDREHDLYGNWPRNVQGAFEVARQPGYVARFRDWPAVESLIARGHPLVISIGVREGELTGAPYARTAGHLIVITGFDERGDVHVNDPAADDEARGVTTYRRDEVERVWMRRGGTAYVIGAALE